MCTQYENLHPSLWVPDGPTNINFWVFDDEDLICAIFLRNGLRVSHDMCCYVLIAFRLVNCARFAAFLLVKCARFAA